MNEHKHTPGPWYVEKPVGQTIMTHNPVAPFDSVVATAYGGSADKSGERRRANAHLIAAAPDMLATLLAIAEHNITLPHNPAIELAEIKRKARAAIASATGA